MILLLDAVLFSTIVGLVTGGKLRRLGSVTLRGEKLLLAVLVLQLSLVRLPLGGYLPESVLVYGAWMLPALVLVSTLFLNRRTPGFTVALIGVGLNIIVVSLNGGMPVQGASMASVPTRFGAFLDASWLHIPIEPSTRLAVLADILPVPGPAWHRGLVSLGDVLLVAGVAFFVFLTMHMPEPEGAETSTA